MNVHLTKRVRLSLGMRITLPNHLGLGPYSGTVNFVNPGRLIGVFQDRLGYTCYYRRSYLMAEAAVVTLLPCPKKGNAACASTR